ncbi:MAG: hypothetical protein K0S65_1487 [Labilithrix sp.]|nr:hypothetical protein [Labilithrix sp.]
MRSTRPLPERRPSLAGVAICAALSCAVAHCSSDDDRPGFDGSDAGQGPSLPEAGSVTYVDGSRDLGPFDPTPPKIECASDPCAVGLTGVTRRSFDGMQSFCALLRDGTVACWGANGEGQLGRGDDAGSIDSPTAKRVEGLSKIVSLERTCAVDADGAAWCWGMGLFLQAAPAFPTTERTPVKLPFDHVSKISVGETVGCVIAERRLRCWGSNSSAQLAPHDDTNERLILPPTDIPLPSALPPRDVHIGNATFVPLEDGTILSWGFVPTVGRLTSLQPDGNPRPLTLTGTVTSMDVQGDNACAAVSGVGYCWGSGKRYDALDLTRALPVPLGLDEHVRQVSMPARRINDPVTGGVSQDRWCAVGQSGAVHCWGNNTSGQSGSGTLEFTDVPVKVAGLPAPAVKVEALLDATCALLTNGKVYCWGGDIYGQLGNGQLRMPSLTPQEVVLP